MIDLITIDMDGCAAGYEGSFQSSWSAAVASFGLGERYDELAKYYYNRRESGQEWMAKVAILFKGKLVSDVSKALFPIPYSIGFRDFISGVRKYCKVGLLTTGINLVADKLKQETKLDFAFSTTLHTENGKFKGTFECPVPQWRKAEALERLASEFDYGLARVCHIGDNDNDVPCFDLLRIAGGLSIAFNPKTQLTSTAADYTVYDFRDVLPLVLNYSEEK